MKNRKIFICKIVCIVFALVLTLQVGALGFQLSTEPDEIVVAAEIPVVSQSDSVLLKAAKEAAEVVASTTSIAVQEYSEETLNFLQKYLEKVATRKGCNEEFVTSVNALGTILYDNVSKVLYTKGDKGFLGFNYDAATDTYFSATNPWQENFGYCTIYDFASPIINLNFYTDRFYFTYGGKDWLIQIWKGQYGITTGAEIGVYCKDAGKSSMIYECAPDAECPAVEMRIYKKGEPLMHRKSENFFWLTGFKMNEFTSPYNLRMNASIKFKNKDMANAFVASAVDRGFVVGSSLKVDGATVSFAWE